MAKKAITDDKFAIVDRLSDIKKGKAVSRYLKDKLHGMGYLEMHESRAPGQRGQPTKSFTVTTKGNNYIKLSNTWKRS